MACEPVCEALRPGDCAHDRGHAGREHPDRGSAGHSRGGARESGRHGPSGGAGRDVWAQPQLSRRACEPVALQPDAAGYSRPLRSAVRRHLGVRRRAELPGRIGGRLAARAHRPLDSTRPGDAPARSGHGVLRAPEVRRADFSRDLRRAEHGAGARTAHSRPGSQLHSDRRLFGLPVQHQRLAHRGLGRCCSSCSLASRRS